MTRWGSVTRHLSRRVCRLRCCGRGGRDRLARMTRCWARAVKVVVAGSSGLIGTALRELAASRRPRRRHAGTPRPARPARGAVGSRAGRAAVPTSLSAMPSTAPRRWSTSPGPASPARRWDDAYKREVLDSRVVGHDVPGDRHRREHHAGPRARLRLGGRLLRRHRPGGRRRVRRRAARRSWPASAWRGRPRPTRRASRRPRRAPAHRHGRRPGRWRLRPLAAPAAARPRRPARLRSAVVVAHLPRRRGRRDPARHRPRRGRRPGQPRAARAGDQRRAHRRARAGPAPARPWSSPRSSRSRAVLGEFADELLIDQRMAPGVLAATGYEFRAPHGRPRSSTTCWAERRVGHLGDPPRRRRVRAHERHGPPARDALGHRVPRRRRARRRRRRGGRAPAAPRSSRRPAPRSTSSSTSAPPSRRAPAAATLRASAASTAYAGPVT